MKNVISKQAMVRCGNCGREFYCDTRESWVFKRVFDGKSLIFCKWSCMRAFDRKHPMRKNAETRIGMRA